MKQFFQPLLNWYDYPCKTIPLIHSFPRARQTQKILTPTCFLSFPKNSKNAKC